MAAMSKFCIVRFALGQPSGKIEVAALIMDSDGLRFSFGNWAYLCSCTGRPFCCVTVNLGLLL